MRDGAATVPVITPDENRALSRMAAAVLPQLLALLERHQTDIRAAFDDSPYADEVTFEEYFMWWYHLYYTAVTDRLISEGHVERPGAGITSYVIAE